MPAHRPSPLNRVPQLAWLASASLCLGAGVLALAAAQTAAQESSAPRGPPGVRADREPALIRMVRQDCGSCHGMRLTGGLGPPLTREALADKPLDGLAATIFQGRPGTPMPPWRALLSEAESWWIAEQLMRGFPEERPRADSIRRPPQGPRRGPFVALGDEETSGGRAFPYERRAQP